MKKHLIAVAAAIVSVSALTACSSAEQADSANGGGGASEYSNPAPIPEPEIPEPVEPENTPFGQVATYVDDVSITVSHPQNFVPGEYAAGATGVSHVVFVLTVTNGTTTNFEPHTYTTVTSGGAEGSQIFDSGNPIGEVLGGPSGVILPGQSISWMEAYSVADPSSIVLTLAPGFDYEDVVFTNVK